MMYPSDNIRRILFLDIESVVEVEHFLELSEDMRLLWQKKSRRHVDSENYPYFDEELEALYRDKAGIYAEFAKVICISVGYIQEQEEGPEMRIKSFGQSDEVELLRAFAHLLNEYYYDRHNQFLCGHNLKEFDVPFICRRMMIHQIPLPNLLDIAGFRPWQTHHLLDTMEMWKYGDYKHYTSLELLCAVLKVPTPKSSMSGKEVHGAYWEGRLAEIIQYCEQDVIATARVYLRCIGQEGIPDNKISLLKSDQEE